jgi:hypothetical protein
MISVPTFWNRSDPARILTDSPVTGLEPQPSLIASQPRAVANAVVIDNGVLVIKAKGENTTR